MSLSNKGGGVAGREYCNIVTPSSGSVACTFTRNYCTCFVPSQAYTKVYYDGTLVYCSGTTPHAEGGATYRFLKGDSICTSCASVMFGYFFD